MEYLQSLDCPFKTEIVIVITYFPEVHWKSSTECARHFSQIISDFYNNLENL